MNRVWQQDEGKDNRLNETKALAAHFLNNGVLLTMRWRVPGLAHTDLINQETTFYASLEQAEDLATAILAHVSSQKAVQP